jgi:hypothetical protein
MREKEKPFMERDSSRRFHVGRPVVKIVTFPTHTDARKSKQRCVKPHTMREREKEKEKEQQERRIAFTWPTISLLFHICSSALSVLQRLPAWCCFERVGEGVGERRKGEGRERGSG